jgi:Tfp pilus assembly protein PilF
VIVFFEAKQCNFSARYLAAVIAAALSFPAPAGDADSLVEKGEAQLKSGQIDAAVQTLKKAVAEDPSSSLAYTRLGGAWVLKREYAAGLQSFKRAISLDANNATAFVGMAFAYLHTGRYVLARAALEEAKRIDPSKKTEADRLIAWIDERAPANPH